MQELRVQVPLGALLQDVGKSGIPRVPETRERWFESSRPDLMRWVLCWYGRATVNRFVAGSIPASAAFAKRKGKPIGDGSRFESGRAISLESSTLSPSAYNNVLLAERQRLQASNLARRVRLSQSTLQIDWVGSSAAEQVPVKYQRAGSSPARPSQTRCGVVAVGSDAWP